MSTELTRERVEWMRDYYATALKSAPADDPGFAAWYSEHLALCSHWLATNATQGAADDGSTGWRDISTAPMNQQVFALYKGKWPVIAIQRPANDSPSGWCHDRALNEDSEHRGLTHWHPIFPLPPPPSRAGEETR